MNKKLPDRLECANCKKMFRSKGMLHVKENGEYKHYCGNCKKKRVTNPFYISQEQRNISKYNLSDAERRVQHDQLMSTGMTSQAAWLRVNRTAKYLQNAKKRKRYEFYSKMNKIKQEKELKEKQKKDFLEGLK